MYTRRVSEPRIAFATCRQYSELVDDDRRAIPELVARGVRVEAAIWDDASVDWARFDLVVVRSTWDYPERRDAFLAWADSVPRLANPAAVLRWNTDKRYLRDLASAGVPVVPTAWFEPGDAIRLPEGGVHVVKPSVGAGSRGAGRFDLGNAAERALAETHARRLHDEGATVMVQPYLDAVDVHGETAILHFGGRRSHAIRKAPLLAGPETEVSGLFREEQIAARVPSEAEVAAADAVLAAIPRRFASALTYARVDLLPSAEGRPLLLELELSEPSLFLAYDEGAPARFAEAIVAALEPRR